MDIQTIAQNLTCTQNDIKNKIIDKLKSLGWSDSDISNIDEQLNIISETVLRPQSVITKQYSDELQNQIDIQNNINETINKSKIEKTIQNAKQIELDKTNKDKLTFYADKEVIKYSEPIVTGITTSPVDLEDAHYTLKENYPQSYGFIDKVKNWYRINMAKKSAEFVHSSGTQIKVDRDGNVTIWVKGKLKQVIEGDYTLKVKGNMDIIVDGNRNDTTLETHTISTGGPQIRLSSSSIDDKAPMITHN